METNTNTAIKNSTYNFIGYVYPMLLAFIVAPITVNFLGIRNYGLYVFLSTILSLMGLLELGTSTAVSRYITKYNASNSIEKIKKTTGSANSIFSLVGLVGCFIFLSIAFGGHFFISSSLINYSNYPIAFIFAGLLFLTTSMSSVYVIIPNALGRFDLSNKIGIITITLQQISIIVVLLTGYSISTIFATQFIIAIINGLLNRRISKLLLPHISFSFAWDKEKIINFYKFGFTTFINNIAGSSLTYFDRIIIPFFLGPSNLTYYSLPGNITSKTPGISNALSGIIFPMAAHFDSLGDKEKIKKLYIRSTRLILVLSTAITVSMTSFSYQMLQYWINNDVANKASSVLIILAFTGLILSILSPISNLLLGLGKLKSLITSSIIMAVLNIILLFILIPRFGILGAAWAYLLSLIPTIWLIYQVESQYLKLGAKRLRYYITIISKLLLVSLISYTINIFILKNYIKNIGFLVIIGPLSIFIFISIYKAFGFFEKEDVSDIKNFIGRLFKKKLKNDF